jgi:tRNA threonylcarbamoyladenosine biosynthesis protein TsaB
MGAMILFLDTTVAKKLIVELRVGDEIVVAAKRDGDLRHAQHVLELVDEVLQKQHLELNNLASIIVNAGPGSFTGTRVGVSVANALGFALAITVNGSFDPVVPVYASEPHITPP